MEGPSALARFDPAAFSDAKFGPCRAPFFNLSRVFTPRCTLDAVEFVNSCFSPTGNQSTVLTELRRDLQSHEETLQRGLVDLLNREYDGFLGSTASLLRSISLTLSSDNQRLFTCVQVCLRIWTGLLKLSTPSGPAWAPFESGLMVFSCTSMARSCPS